MARIAVFDPVILQPNDALSGQEENLKKLAQIDTSFTEELLIKHGQDWKQAKRLSFPASGRHGFEESVANPWISSDQALRNLSQSTFPSGSRKGAESQWGGSRWGVRLRYITSADRRKKRGENPPIRAPPPPTHAGV